MRWGSGRMGLGSGILNGIGYFFYCELSVIDEPMSVINKFHLKKFTKDTWKWEASQDDNFKMKKAQLIVPLFTESRVRSLLSKHPLGHGDYYKNVFLQE